MTQTEYEIIGLIKEIYKTYPTGGALHIVLDDGNDEDHWIKYCITDKCFKICEISDKDQWLFVRCAELLLTIKEHKRGDVIYQAHKEIREERAKQPKSESGIKLSSEKLSGVIIAKKRRNDR